MPRTSYVRRSERLVAFICQRLEAGETMRSIARHPGMPASSTPYKWQARDPALRQRFRLARAAGRLMADNAPFSLGRYAFDVERALRFLERLRRGGSVKRLLGTPDGPPDRKVYDYWRRTQPDFAQQLAEALAIARRLQRARRRWPWDEAVADRIILRVNRGETMPAIYKDPQMPGQTHLKRWRRLHPEFDGALKIAMLGGHRIRWAARSTYTPKIAAEIEDRLIHGASRLELHRAPDMPSKGTIRNWSRRHREFAAQLASAETFRDDMLAETAIALAAEGIRRPREEARKVLASWREAADRDDA
jgi:hypothetical protein